MTTRLRPPGSGAPARRPYGLGSRARLRRERSIHADAQRRYNAAACPLPDPPPQAGERKEKARAGGEERVLIAEKTKAGRWFGRPPGEVELTLLTHDARALYEGRVVSVRELARLCGVSIRTLYHHVHKQGWRRRRSSVPRDPAKSERQKRWYRALKALRPARPGGLKARDADGQARALAAVERGAALAGPALSQALARQDAEACARILAVLSKAMRDLALARGLIEKPQKKAVERGQGKPRRRPYQWRPMYVPPPDRG